MAGMALCATAASCSSDDDAVSAPKTLSATATIDNSNTRTSYEDQGAGMALEVDWKDSETFKAYYTEGGTTPLIFTKTDGSAFVATDVPEGVSASTTFTGVYGQKVTYNPETGKYAIDFSGQDGTLENLAKYDIMVANSTTDANGLKFGFKHVCAFVKVTLKRGSNTTENTVAGRRYFSLEFGEACLADPNMQISGMDQREWIDSKALFIINFNLASDLALNEERTLYLAVPALNYKSNSRSTFIGSGQGYHKSVSLSNSFKLEAGKVYETSIDYQGSVWGTGVPD